MGTSLLHGKLSIQKRTFPEWMVFIILMFPFAFGCMTEILHIPGLVRYLLDAIIAFFFLFFLLKRDWAVKRNVSLLFALVVTFFVYTLITSVYNFQSPFYYVWGLRNNFKFYLAFFLFVTYVNEDYANTLLRLLDGLFWVNAAVSFVQFFLLGVWQDNLGGLFGSRGATNGYTLIFFSIIVARSLLKTFNGEEKPLYCACKCVTALVVAAMAELKFFYFVFILILVLASLVTKFSRRKLVIVIVSVIAVAVGSVLLSSIFSRADGFFSFEKLIHYATSEHYSTGNDLNRFTAIPTLMNNYVTEPLQQIFGLGLGNCDVSEVSVFNTPFYQQYSYLHYTWFSSAMVFLETGFVGLALYVSFFLICFVSAYRSLKRGRGNRLFCQIAVIMSALCIVLMFYNSSLRAEFSHMMYFCLALPFLSPAE
ncbi:MAG: hypothetical protein J6B54_02230 [Clostridia bacterium]|nr:hypothetical protein [Clostridia bacterium]